MADEQRRFTDRIASQRDADKEVLEAWFQGTGSTVVLGFFILASLVLAVVVAKDSLLLAGLLVLSGPAFVIAKKNGWL